MARRRRLRGRCNSGNAATIKHMNAIGLRCMRVLLVILGVASLAAGWQQPTNQPSATGLETPWDVRQILSAIDTDTEQFRPILDNLKPQRWSDEKGAPSTYIIQWQTAQRQLGEALSATQALAQKTESISVAIDTYFRLEALEVTMRSLAEGASRYADRATGDKLNALIARSFNNRERFRGYLKDLTTSTEQNFKIADEEAQRCRGMISKEPPSPAKRSKKD